MTIAPVRAHHGTTQEALAAIRSQGKIRAQDPRVVAAAVEERYGLAPGAVWAHPWNDFGRNRLNDPHVYFHADAATAWSYAEDGSETLLDALKTAYRIQYPPTDDDDGSAYYRAATAWAKAEAATWCRPAVVALDVPWDVFAASRDLLISPEEFWALVGEPEGVGGVALVGPVPASWIVGELSPTLTAGALR